MPLSPQAVADHYCRRALGESGAESRRQRHRASDPGRSCAHRRIPQRAAQRNDPPRATCRGEPAWRSAAFWRARGGKWSAVQAALIGVGRRPFRRKRRPRSLWQRQPELKESKRESAWTPSLPRYGRAWTRWCHHALIWRAMNCLTTSRALSVARRAGGLVAWHRPLSGVQASSARQSSRRAGRVKIL
jgi:hypothetical protein